MDSIPQDLPREIWGEIIKYNPGLHMSTIRASKITKNILKEKPKCDWDFVRHYILINIVELYKELSKDKNFELTFCFSSTIPYRYPTNIEKLLNFGGKNIASVSIEVSFDSEYSMKNNLYNYLKKYPVLYYLAKIKPYSLGMKLNFIIDPYFNRHIKFWSLKKRTEICDLAYGVLKETSKYRHIRSHKIKIISIEKSLPTINQLKNYIEQIANKSTRYCSFPIYIDVYNKEILKLATINAYNIKYISANDMNVTKIGVYPNKDIMIDKKYNQSKSENLAEDVDFLSKKINRLFRKEKEYITRVNDWNKTVWSKLPLTVGGALKFLDNISNKNI